MMLTSRLAKATLSLGLSTTLAAGGAAAAIAQPEAGTELRLYNWDEFVNPQIVEDFEAESGIKVIIETFDDENEMQSVVQADPSRYDLFITSDATLYEMVQQRLVAELDHGNIPNLANIDPTFLDLPTDPGNRYSVPYDWGTTGIAYNTDCVQPQEQSWGLLLDPTVSGRIAMDTDFTVVLASTLKYLGYPLNSTDPVHIDEAVAFLRDLRSQHGLRLIVWDDMLDMLGAGELCVVQAFNGDTAVYMDEYENIGFFVPNEGSDFYLDVLAIPRDAQNKVGAELFIDYILRPDVHAANNEYTGYAVPNRASIEGGHVSAELMDDPVRYPNTAGLEAWKPFGYETLGLWNKAWADFIVDA
jgi:spermidine/putrescine transport system substrate-binding protein